MLDLALLRLHPWRLDLVSCNTGTWCLPAPPRCTQDLRGNIRVFCRVRPRGRTGDSSASMVEVRAAWRWRPAVHRCTARSTAAPLATCCAPAHPRPLCTPFIAARLRQLGEEGQLQVFSEKHKKWHAYRFDKASAAPCCAVRACPVLLRPSL